MRDLVVGVVVDIDGKVRIEHLQRCGVGWIPAAARDLVVLDSAELVVLHPEIAFEDLGRGGETEHGRVAFGQTAVIVVLPRSGAALSKYEPGAGDAGGQS